MRVYGNARTGGSIEVAVIPYPTDPTLHRPRAPLPAPPTRVDDIPARPTGQTLSDADCARIARDHANGQSATVLAIRYGVVRTTIYRALRRAKEAS